MNATDTKPTVKTKTVRVETKTGTQEATYLVGLGRDILLKQMPVGHNEAEVYSETISGNSYLRRLVTERHFVGSPNLPEGLDIGVLIRMTDTGVGQPFAEQSAFQCGQDAYDRIHAYAYNEPWLSMQERREIAKRSQQWLSEKGAKQQTREGTVTPSEVFADVVDKRLQEKINKMVEEKVAAALAGKK